ncbi:MAG: hypothetical protein IPH85_05085 [Ignavibacteria bacterium]|nr:hypothetical protein [Ignavibacteria bacterium]MBP6509103.1 hypothetical protein [Candidatus Kapabacteria bacterium]MBK6419072.1 hypothetical protein [Ignavibacteria bacterium]MBK6760242.1 hypothetical protein [Ignavibacteria bacterium]MBK7034017.1 hypothetical protein [Ignavibacteria bacterium]
MRRLALIIGILAVTSVAGVAVQVTLQYFQAKSNGTSVSLEWKSNNEPDLVQYEIERAGEDNAFRYIATVQAKGNNQSYTYRDDEAFGKRDGNDGSVARNYFTYRLKMIGADQNTSYSNTVGVTHNVSGIKRTWGMIKEMFR